MQEDLSILRSLVSECARHSPNLTIWFSHHPSATISADHSALRELMGSSVAHVCGHLHTLRGLVDGLYGRHPSGHLELELADFKDNRRLKYTCVCVRLLQHICSTLCFMHLLGVSMNVSHYMYYRHTCTRVFISLSTAGWPLYRDVTGYGVWYVICPSECTYVGSHWLLQVPSPGRGS